MNLEGVSLAILVVKSRFAVFRRRDLCEGATRDFFPVLAVYSSREEGRAVLVAAREVDCLTVGREEVALDTVLTTRELYGPMLDAVRVW